MGLGSYHWWRLVKFFQQWKGDLISCISWRIDFFKIVLCLCRRIVCVTFENTWRLESLSCVWRDNYLWCSVAPIVGDSGRVETCRPEIAFYVIKLLLNKDRPTWCHLLYYFTIYCSKCFECCTSIFRSLRLAVDLFHVLYCSGSMCVGVTVWFGWVVCYPYAGWSTSASACIRIPLLRYLNMSARSRNVGKEEGLFTCRAKHVFTRRMTCSHLNLTPE
jgi:hypothetical protein